MASKSGPDIIEDGLVLCLDAASKRSYPGTGTAWTDLTGSNNGTLTNGPTFDSDNGGSIVFDGTNDYLESSSNIGITGISPRTFECWVYVDNYASANVMGGGTASGGQLFDTIIWIGGGYLRVVGHYYGAGLDTIPSLPNRNTINLDQWNHIVHLYDGSDAYLYTNGEFSNSKTLSLNTGNNKIRMARGFHSAYDYFGGKGGVMRVYNKTFTADEIRRNYLSTKERFA
jgi:hypothetical protein